ncbi:MAG: hypothetical protein E3K32_05215 [wastewater metagenome]|nr:hypothetical protein [Candidatus Loosdrechtia aerotolerans]
MRKRIATGIDIGNDAIKIVQIARQGRSLVLLKWVTIPVQEYHKGSRLIEQSPEYLSRTVRSALKKSGINMQNPAVAFSCGDMLFKYFFVPKSVKERIVPFFRLILSSQAAGDIDFGFLKIEGVSRLEKNDLVMVALARKETLEFIHTMKEKLGVVTDYSVPRPLALYNLVTFIEEGTEGECCFCIDIGSEGLDMAIVAKTHIDKPVNRLAFFRSVRREIPEVTDDERMHRAILDEIRQTIAACRRELKLPALTVSSFWVSGERCSDRLQRYLGEHLEKDVQALDPVAAIDLKIPDKKKSGMAAYDFRSMATATGLALGMMNRLPVYIRLIPKQVEIRKRDKKKLRQLKAAMFLAVVTAFAILYYGYHMMNVYRNSSGKVGSAISVYMSNESRLLGIAEGQKSLGMQLRKLKDICEKDFSEAALVSLLGVNIPNDITLKKVDIMYVGGFQSLNQSRWIRIEGDVKVAGENDRPLEILKRYVTDIEKVDGFQGVRFKEIKELSNQAVNFQIECVTD